MEKCKFEKGKKYCSIDFNICNCLDILDNIVILDFEGAIEKVTIQQANLVFDSMQFAECW